MPLSNFQQPNFQQTKFNPLESMLSGINAREQGKENERRAIAGQQMQQMRQQQIESGSFEQEQRQNEVATKRGFEVVQQLKQASDRGEWQKVLELSNQMQQISPKFAAGSAEIAEKLQNMDFNAATQQINDTYDFGVQNGLIGGNSKLDQRTRGLTQEQKKQAQLVDLGLEARASMTGTERIALNKGLSGKVADSQAEITGAREGAKLGAELAYKPRIARDVKLATLAAKERGESLTDLSRATAAMPGLNDAVGELRELSSIATSTYAGRLFDIAVKESGFGATKGKTARSKFIAIINNQVLPLLKDTFGAAFTEKEGEALKKTMGDPDSSPEEKMAELDAFIAQKKRDIETKKRMVGEPADQLSDDELLKKYGG